MDLVRKTRVLLALAACVTLMPCLPAAAVNSVSASITHVSQEGGTVKVYFDAVDEKGSPVGGLYPGDVAIMVNGAAVPAASLMTTAQSDEGYATLILADVSYGLNEKNQTALRSGIRRCIQAMRVSDMTALMTFGVKSSVLVDFTNNKDTLLSANQGIKYAKTNTYLLSGLVDAVDYFDASTAKWQLPQRHIVIMLSDGQDNGSPSSAETRLTEQVEKGGITLYVVGYNTYKDTSSFNTLGRAAIATGGTMVLCDEEDTGAAIQGAFERLLLRLKDSYIATADITGARINPGKSNVGVRISGDSGVGSSAQVMAALTAVTPPPTKQPTPAPTPAPTAVPTPTAAPTRQAVSTTAPTVTPVPAKTFAQALSDNIIWVIAALAVLILVIAGVLFLPRLLNKNKKAPPKPIIDPKQPNFGRTHHDKTMFAGGGAGAGTGAGARTGAGGHEATVRSSNRTHEKTVGSKHEATMSVPGSGRMSVTIAVTSANEDNRNVPAVIEGKFTIGRSDACSLPIRDSQVSWEHASLSCVGGTIVVQDLGSSNGTFINDERVTRPMPIKGGDLIRLGPLTRVIVRPTQ
ncbi:MAG: FHA domain-containing protein [Oscillospiraceae bacterium]|jgi:hypothetical protein|nr:FHA domain-containing protein [Oscillospiraceae bacterium]